MLISVRVHNDTETAIIELWTDLALYLSGHKPVVEYRPGNPNRFWTTTDEGVADAARPYLSNPKYEGKLSFSQH